jgi:hypothetical protein
MPESREDKNTGSGRSAVPAGCHELTSPSLGSFDYCQHHRPPAGQLPGVVELHLLGDAEAF